MHFAVRRRSHPCDLRARLSSTPLIGILRTGPRGISDRNPDTGSVASRERQALGAHTESSFAHSARVELRGRRTGISLIFVQAHACLLAKRHSKLVHGDAVRTAARGFSETSARELACLPPRGRFAP